MKNTHLRRIHFGWSQMGWLLLCAISLSSEAFARCPEILSRLQSDSLPSSVRSLCELHDRYQAAKQEIATQTGAPVESTYLLGNAIAPRLIELHTWKAALGDGYTSPWFVYKPAPLTWERFQAAATLVERQSLENYRLGQLSKFSESGLSSLHRTSLKTLFGTAGKFRSQNMDVLPQVNQRFSLTRDEVEQLRKIEYRYASGERLVQWTPVVCIEDLSAEELRKFKSALAAGDAHKKSTYLEIPADQFFQGSDGLPRQCGHYGYAKGSKVKGLLQQFIADINQAIEALNRGDKEIDPLLLASHAQRRYVTIHPHDDGNGRMSRFIMDTLLLSLGLPAPILPDMSRDIFISEKEWARRIGEGMLMTIEAFENCARDMKQKGCSLTSELPPADGRK